MLIVNILYIGICSSDGTVRVRPNPEDDGTNQGKPIQGNTVNANFPNDYGSIQIDKFITPKFADFYVKDQIYPVHIKISGIGRELNNISIKEEVSPALEIRSFKIYPYIIDPFDDLSQKNMTKLSLKDKNKKMCVWKDNYSIDQKNIYIKIDLLKPKRSIEYEYELIPRVTGIYSDITTIRIGGEASKLPDAMNKIELDIREPEFNVIPSEIEPYGYVDKPVEVSYEIIHEKGSCSGPIRIDVALINTTKYNISWDKNPITISPFKSTSVNMSIYYRDSGLQLLPPIFINDIPYAITDRTINIYRHQITRLGTEFHATLTSTSAIISMLVIAYSILIYILSKMDKELKKLTETTDKDLKRLTEIERVRTKIKYRYVNVGEIVEDPNKPHWWR